MASKRFDRLDRRHLIEPCLRPRPLVAKVKGRLSRPTKETTLRRPETLVLWFQRLFPAMGFFAGAHWLDSYFTVCGPLGTVYPGL